MCIYVCVCVCVYIYIYICIYIHGHVVAGCFDRGEREPAARGLHGHTKKRHTQLQPSGFTTQFTCFTGTNVQILTLRAPHHKRQEKSTPQRIHISRGAGHALQGGGGGGGGWAGGRKPAWEDPHWRRPHPSPDCHPP